MVRMDEDGTMRPNVGYDDHPVNTLHEGSDCSYKHYIVAVVLDGPAYTFRGIEKTRVQCLKHE
jgi:hypothetical protein